MQVDALDKEHDECAAALRTFTTLRTPAALLAVRESYSSHFAHEEQLLDEYLYANEAACATEGTFSASAGQRRSHFADHSRLIKEIDDVLRTTSDLVPPRVVDAVLRNFELHANSYDSTYAEPLARALTASG